MFAKSFVGSVSVPVQFRVLAQYFQPILREIDMSYLGHMHFLTFGMRIIFTILPKKVAKRLGIGIY